MIFNRIKYFEIYGYKNAKKMVKAINAKQYPERIILKPLFIIN